MTKTIDITHLKPEQVEHIQFLVKAFEAKNNLESEIKTQDKLSNLEYLESSGIFFESEII